MRPNNHTLDRQRVHRAAAEHLQAHLKFKDYKRKTSAQALWSLLLAAAAASPGLSDACQRLLEGPSDETARKAPWPHPRLRHAPTATQLGPWQPPP